MRTPRKFWLMPSLEFLKLRAEMPPSDSGPGIDPEHIERVFDSFYTTKPSGVGMGLSIRRSIMDARGCRLRADANEPRGA
jgi:C4-dicarboxylate-specific signal transduction histidine kinase